MAQIPQEFLDSIYNQGYNKAIDDVLTMIKSYSEDDKLMNSWYVELVEQLKGEKNE